MSELEIKDAVVPDDTDTEEESNESMIVHREKYIDGKGVQQVREHGPMPISKWRDYERKNNL